MTEYRLDKPIEITTDTLSALKASFGRLIRCHEEYDCQVEIYWGLMGYDNKVSWFGSLFAGNNVTLCRLLEEIYLGNSKHRFNDIVVTIGPTDRANLIQQVQYRIDNGYKNEYKASEDLDNLKDVGMF